jgi:hypothetical protein
MKFSKPPGLPGGLWIERQSAPCLARVYAGPVEQYSIVKGYPRNFVFIDF